MSFCRSVPVDYLTTEYLANAAKIRILSGTYYESRARYEQKVTEAGLCVDPYSIDSWEINPEMVPNVHWSDMVVYMAKTPSPYTCESVKVYII